MLLSVGLPYFLSVSNLFMSVVSIKYSGTLLIQSPIGKKKLAVLTRFFFLQENDWQFLPDGEKEAAVITRWPYY